MYNECLKLNSTSNNQVIGTNCSSPTIDMFWIWTSTANKQLMNVKNLKCMQRTGNAVTIKQCNTKQNKQEMQCTEYGKGMKIGWTTGFLHLNQSKSRVEIRDSVPQQWSGKKQTPCETSRAYNGIAY